MDRRGLECQLNVVRQVCSEARRHGLACHGLGLVLEPQHVKKAVDRGLNSFDATWTRPNKSIVKKYLGAERLAKGLVSAKTMSEKDLFLFLWIKIQQLQEAGITLAS